MALIVKCLDATLKDLRQQGLMSHNEAILNVA